MPPSGLSVRRSIVTQARPLKGPDENPDFPRTPVGTTHGVSPGCRQYLQVDREALWRTRERAILSSHATLQSRVGTVPRTDHPRAERAIGKFSADGDTRLFTSLRKACT